MNRAAAPCKVGTHREDSSGRFDTADALRPLALIMAGAAVLRTYADPDLWGHVRFGLDLIDTRRLTATDPYSFTRDIPWVNHEWLSELASAAAYAFGGRSPCCC